MSYTRLTIFTDGASRGNPGAASVGVHIVDATRKQTVAELSTTIGTATNNVAEYRAVLFALEWLLAHRNLLADSIHLSFRADSQLVVSQLRGEYKIKKPELTRYASEIQEHLRTLPGTHTFDLIPREENKRADQLANEALDDHSSLS